MDEGKFRQDLFYRINVIEVHVPPLRHRQNDVTVLSEHILEKLTKESGLQKPQLDATAIEALKQYSFPGNVRELENILERAITLCENNLIKAEDLNLPVASGEKTPEDDARGEIVSVDVDVDVDIDMEIEPGKNFSLEKQLENIERTAILKALEKTKYNKTAAFIAVSLEEIGIGLSVFFTGILACANYYLRGLVFNYLLISISFQATLLPIQIY